MTGVLVRRLGAVFVLLLVFFLLATEFVGLPWMVSGPSMEPSLRHGDRVIVDLWTYRHRAPRPGEVVLLRGPMPGHPVLIKRVAALPASEGDGIWVLGDHAAESTDSRHFGRVPVSQVRGRVVLRYWPLSRIKAF